MKENPYQYPYDISHNEINPKISQTSYDAGGGGWIDDWFPNTSQPIPQTFEPLNNSQVQPVINQPQTVATPVNNIPVTTQQVNNNGQAVTPVNNNDTLAITNTNNNNVVNLSNIDDKLKQFVNDNPIVAFGGLALIVYLVFIKN